MEKRGNREIKTLFITKKKKKKKRSFKDFKLYVLGVGEEEGKKVDI